MNAPDTLLSRIFGFDAFRPGQREIVDAINAGKDVLAIMPTGGGKSLCFQLPALSREGVTVVISPLIALMRDQVRALREVGVEAGSLTSGNTEEETEAVFEALDEGRLKLLYMAPERLSRSGTEQLLRRINVSLIAVDEAHCVSQWGHDFRPDYLEIGKLGKSLGVQLAAFTATADAETRDEIAARLFTSPPEVFLHGFDRPNIRLAFAPKATPRKQLLDFVTARRGQPGIIYCGTRNKTEVMATAIRAEGIESLAYHAGMNPDDRRLAETRFQREDGLVVCATVAFGMGIDKPDIRYVLHADLPKSVESYYQEIGRAGRDGAPAETLTLFGAEDIRLRRSQIDEGYAPNDRKQADHARLNALLGLAETPVCRRRVLLKYFGEDRAEDCGNCDICIEKPETFDGTQAAQKAFSAVLRTGEYFGVEHLTNILVGDATDKVKARRHHELPTFGVGKEFTKAQWRTIFRQLMGLDLLRPDAERHGALRFTEAARPLLKGNDTITLRKDTIAKAGTSSRKSPVALVDEEDEPLLALLKSKRRELAEAAKAPAYIIFSDRTLIDMAQKRPTNRDEMRDVTGVGAAKLKKYGDMFLALINGEPPAAQHPVRKRMAGRDEASTYDRLKDAQVVLVRGENGLETFLACNSATLARIAKENPTNPEALARIKGMTSQTTARFGPAFLEILNEPPA